MADQAHILTDEKLEKMEKRLSAIYSRAAKEIGVAWDDYLSEIGKETKELQNLYDKAKKSGNNEETRKIGRKLSQAKKEKTLMNKRYKDVTETVARELAHVNETALAYINGQLPDVYAVNYNALEDSVNEIAGYSFSLVDADVVRNLAVNDPVLLPYKEIDEKKDIKWNRKKMNAEVLQGILQGESMDKIAKRLKNVVDMNESAAIRNARTMVTSAENKGRQDSYARATADGIILQKEWLETNDGRTRHTHQHKPIGVGGEIVNQDEMFSNGLMYPADPNGKPSEVYNCRCTMIPIVKGFKKVKYGK